MKGRLDGHVEVHAPLSSASCGLAAELGTRAGLLLYRRGEAWTSSLCSQLRPDELLRAARPLPAPTGRGPVAFVVGGRFGPARLLALDERGRTISYGRDARHTTAFVAVCPGGRRVAEVVLGRQVSLAIWTLPRLRLVRERRLPLAWSGIAPSAARCLDPLGRDVAVFAADSNRPEGRARLLRVGPRHVRVVWRGTALAAGLTARIAFLSAGPRGDRALSVDLASGRARALARVPALTGPLHPSPDGRLLAAVAAPEPRLAAEPARLVVVDVARARARTVPLGRHSVGGVAVWLGPGLLGAFPYGGETGAGIYDRSLRLARRLPPWPAPSAVLRGTTVYGADHGGRVLALATRSGRLRTFTRLPGPVATDVAAVPARG